MAWQIEFGTQAKRDFARLDKPIQRDIFRYLNHRVATASDTPAPSARRFDISSPASGDIGWETIA